MAGLRTNRGRARLFGRNWWNSRKEFLYLKPMGLKERGRDKMEARWEEGIFLGLRMESLEVLVGTHKGVIKVRDIKRMDLEKGRWDADFAAKIRESLGNQHQGEKVLK